MKNIFKKLSPAQTERVTERALTYNIVACVVGVLLCLTSLTAATWAWFGDNITSVSNDLQTGVYELGITVKDQSNTTIDPVVSADGSQSDYYVLKKDMTYTVTLKGEGSVTTGYCIVSFEDIVNPSKVATADAIAPKKIYTSQIFTENAAADKTPREITFEVTADADLHIYFNAFWGTCSKEPEILDAKGYTYRVSTETWAVAEAGTPDESGD